MTPESWNQLRYIEKVRAIAKTLSTEHSAHVISNRPYYVLLFSNLVKELPNTWGSETQRKVAATNDLQAWLDAIEKDLSENVSHTIKRPVFQALKSLGSMINDKPRPQHPQAEQREAEQ
jgi:hypothetical protein